MAVTHLPNGRYLLTRYEDVKVALREIEVFLGSMRDPGITVPDDEQLLIEMREPRHGRVRRFFNLALSKVRIANIEVWIRSLYDNALDQIFASEEAVDLAAIYVRTIPSAVIARLVGAPVEDHSRIAAWADDLSQSEWLARNVGPLGPGLEYGFPEFYNYIRDLMTRCRAGESEGDFLSWLMQTEVDGVRLSEKEVIVIVALMLQAGSETTRYLLANMVFHLANSPALIDVLKEEPRRIPQFVEEMLRFYPPVATLLRDVPEATVIDGCPVPAVSKAALSLASANRDPNVFECPHEFRVDRANFLSHLSFGTGPHICPGAALARLEARIGTEVLVERVSRIELDPNWRYVQVPVFWANGPRDIMGRMIPRPDGRVDVSYI
jgi:cytochrome P450